MKHARTLAARALGAAVALLALAPAAARAQTPPPAQQLLDRYVQAMGGRAALEAQQFRTTRGEMSLPAMGATMTLESFAARPNRMVVRMTMEGMGTMQTGFDGTVGWTMNPMQGPALMQGKELEQTARQSDFESAYRYDKFFTAMETEARTEMNGQACWPVRMVAVSGDTIRQCFSEETGLLVGSVSTLHSEMGDMESVTLYEAYRDFGGVKVPTRTRTQMMGQEMVFTVREVSTAPIPDEQFALPAEVRTLMASRPGS